MSETFKAKAELKIRRCNCHPETCCCHDYIICIDGIKVAEGSDSNEMELLVDAFNQLTTLTEERDRLDKALTRLCERTRNLSGASFCLTVAMDVTGGAGKYKTLAENADKAMTKLIVHVEEAEAALTPTGVR